MFFVGLRRGGKKEVKDVSGNSKKSQEDRRIYVVNWKTCNLIYFSVTFHGLSMHTWLLTWTHIEWLLTRLLMLSEEMIENGTIFLVDSLHFIDVLGDFLHALQCLNQMHVLIAVWICEILQLKEQEWILEYSLNWLYQI